MLQGEPGAPGFPGSRGPYGQPGLPVSYFIYSLFVQVEYINTKNTNVILQKKMFFFI